MTENRCKLQIMSTGEDLDAATLIPILQMNATAQNATTDRVLWPVSACARPAPVFETAQE